MKRWALVIALLGCLLAVHGGLAAYVHEALAVDGQPDAAAGFCVTGTSGTEPGGGHHQDQDGRGHRRHDHRHCSYCQSLAAPLAQASAPAIIPDGVLAPSGRVVLIADEPESLFFTSYLGGRDPPPTAG